MFRFKRKWWAWVIFFIVLLAPATGLCLERDPYLTRTLIAYLDLEYAHDSFQSGDARSTTTTFTQTYSLTLSGNLLSRRLIIYDAGVSFQDTKISQNFQGSKTINDYKTIDYKLRTVLLPLSAIPLTLYTERTDFFLDSSKNTLTIYGLDWMERIRNLPTTQVDFQRVDATSPQDETINTNVDVLINKQWGPTINDLNYFYQATYDKTHDNNSTMNTVNFDNRTQISRSTQLFVGATDSVHDVPDSPENRISGLNLVLNSITSRELTQSHQYSYYSNSIGGTDGRGQVYSGAIAFTPSDALRAGLSLNLNDTVTQEPTARSDENILSSEGNVTYDITKKLTFSGDVQNSQAQTNLQTAGAPSTDSKVVMYTTRDKLSYSLTEHLFASEDVTYQDFEAKFDGLQSARYTLFTETTNLGYRNDYHKWLRYRAMYGLGYALEKSDGTSDKGSVQNIDLDVAAAPDLGKYMGTRAEAEYRRLTSLSEGTHIDYKTQQYHLEIYNKYYKEYASASVSYDRTKTSSIWMLSSVASPIILAGPPVTSISVTTPTLRPSTPFGMSSEVYQGTVTSNYFSGTSISATAEHSTVENIFTSSVSNDYLFFFASHTRELWGGALNGTLSYYSAKSRSQTGSTSSSDGLLTVSYTRQLLRNLGWNILANAEDRSFTGMNKTEIYSVQNTLNYNLREWLFTASHKYTVTHIGGISSTDNGVFLRVSRVFERHF